MKRFVSILLVLAVLLISTTVFAGKEIILKPGGSDVYYAKIAGETTIIFVAHNGSYDLSSCEGYYKTDEFGVHKFIIDSGISTRLVGADVSCKSESGKLPVLLIKPDLN